MDPIKLLGWSELILRLGGAALLGALLGVNRELNGKPAGLRTNALVSLTSAVVVIGSIGIGAQGTQPPGADAISRTIQGLVTGVGFLGAGVIIREPSGNRIHGLTTAATIWLSSAVGIVCGAGIWSVAIVGAVLTLIILVVGRPFERYLHHKFPNLAEHDSDSHDTRGPK